MDKPIIYIIKFGHHEVQIEPKDYLMDNGSPTILFIAGDKRTLARPPSSVKGLARVGYNRNHMEVPKKFFKKGIFKDIKPEMFKPVNYTYPDGTVKPAGFKAFRFTQEWIEKNIEPKNNE